MFECFSHVKYTLRYFSLISKIRAPVLSRPCKAQFVCPHPFARCHLAIATKSIKMMRFSLENLAICYLKCLGLIVQ